MAFGKFQCGFVISLAEVFSTSLENFRFWNFIESLSFGHQKNLGFDIPIDGRDDLAAAEITTEINLVAVIVWRIVAGGHHDASGEVTELHRVSNYRSWHVAVEQCDSNSCSSQNLSAIIGENIGVHAAVVTNYHRRFRLSFEKIIRKPSGSLGHEYSVHSRSSGAKFPAETSRSKRDSRLKTFL